MRLWLLAFILLAISCSTKKDRILIPQLEADFYDQALSRIDDQLSGDRSNLQLVEQKMYYCERLNWPETCITAIEELKRQKGITPLLLDQYITYYLKHERYEELLAVIDQWAGEFDADRKYLKAKIQALSYMNRKDEALVLLRNYMINKNSKEDIEFAASQYVLLSDTIFSAYYLNKLSEMDPKHPLVYDHYGYLMINLGYPEFGLPILAAYGNDYPEDFDFHQRLSDIYVGLDMLTEARDELKGFIDQDSVVYQITDLFLQENRWDSAQYYVDIILERDSLNREAWWKKASMYEDRGWLSTSLNYYNHLIYLNPDDSLAAERAALVRGKIAYLQRLKFEENKIPVPVIEPKKLRINNE